MGGFLGVVCGLKSEAAAARAAALGVRAPVRIDASGATPARAAAIAEDFARNGARALLSVGLSGGLDPALAPGAFLLATEILDEAGRTIAPPPALALDALESEALDPGAEGPDATPARTARLVGVDRIVMTAADKARLRAVSGADAVDMESHAVARVALARGLRFLAARAIADPASRAIPQAASAAIAPDGSVRSLTTLMAVARRPQDLPALVTLAGDSAAATKSLGRNLGALYLRLGDGLGL